jgi:hypothetical protein
VATAICGIPGHPLQGQRLHSAPAREVTAASIVVGLRVAQLLPMMYHRFKIGQAVVVPLSGPQEAIPSGPYTIVRLLPLADGEPHYRVKSSLDGHERALLEGQIEPAEEQPAERLSSRQRSSSSSSR